MTIGIDASRANRKEKTGIEWYAYHLLNAMKEIADPNDRYLLYTDTALTDELKERPNNWEERLLRWPPGKFWTQGRLSLEMLFRAPDILFIPSHVIPVLHPKRVVLTCHDIGFERRPELYPKAERAYHRWSMRFGVRAATHIIAVSEFTKSELMDVYSVPSKKITVVHHGYFGGTKRGVTRIGEPAQAPASRGPMPSERGARWQDSEPRQQHPYFLYVGRIEAKKNLHVIINAFAELTHAKKIPDDMQLILVGRRGYQSEAILKAAQEKGRGAIRYLPWVPSETLRKLYHGAAAFLFPSLYEGFGLPLLEALSHGLPVIASNIPALREVGEDQTIFVSPTVDGFAEAMNAMFVTISTKEEQEKRKARALQFLWENAAQKTLTVLHNAL